MGFAPKPPKPDRAANGFAFAEVDAPAGAEEAEDEGAHGFGMGAASDGVFELSSLITVLEVAELPDPDAAFNIGSCTFSYILLRALKPSGWASILDIALSVFLIISLMSSGFLAISIDCLIIAGSLSK